jgi:hypothetical protein
LSFAVITSAPIVGNSRPGPPQGEDIEIQLVSGNDHQRQTAANALVEILNQIKGVDNIDRDDGVEVVP